MILLDLLKNQKELNNLLVCYQEDQDKEVQEKLYQENIRKYKKI